MHNHHKKRARTTHRYALALLAGASIRIFSPAANAQDTERADRLNRRTGTRLEAGNAVYVSRIPGIHADASFTTRRGTDDRALIQAVMDSVADRDGIAEIVFDKPVAVRGGLKYHSNCRLRGTNGGGILLLPNSGNVNNFALRNDDPPQVQYDASGNPSYTPAYPTRDVTIEDLIIDGNRAGNAAGSADARQPQGQLQISTQGQNVFGLCAYGVENLTLRNVTVHDSPTYAYHLATVRHVVMDGCRVEVGGTVGNPAIIYNSNQDGLHINGPASDIRVTGFSGAAGNDLIALNTNDGHQSGGEPRRLYSAWNNCVWHGDITNCVFDRCKLENGLFGFRLLAITDVIDRIQILHTQGGTFQFPLQIDAFPGLGAQTGKVGNVLVDGWDMSAPVWDRTRLNGGVGSGGVNPPQVSEQPTDNVDLSNAMVRLGGRIDSVTLRNIRRGANASARPLVYINDRYQQTNIGQLNIDGLAISEPAGSEAPAAQVYIAAPTGAHTPAIGTLRIANVTWQRPDGNPKGRLVQVNGGTIDSLQLQNITAGNIAHIVDISGTRQTRVNNIRASGVRLDNARAADEAFVSAGPVVNGADFSGVTTKGRMVNNSSRFPNMRGEGNRTEPTSSDAAGARTRASTFLSETFTGDPGKSLAGTIPAQRGGVGRIAWAGAPGGDWEFTGNGSVRAATADAGALYSLASAGANVTIRATFKTGNANGAQIVLHSNTNLTGYVAVNLDASGVKVYDLGGSDAPLPNNGPGIGANRAHSVVITLRGDTITVTADNNPPITNTLSRRNADNPFFGIRSYGRAGVEFSAFSIGR